MLEGLKGLRTGPAAVLCCKNGFLNQLLAVIGGLGAFQCQPAHFVRDYGEALPCFPGACGLNSGIQGQDVGLEGDVLDGGDDPPDLLGGLGDVLHSGHHSPHSGGQVPACPP